MKYELVFNRVTVEKITIERHFESESEARQFATVEAANAHRREFTFDPDHGATVEVVFDQTAPIAVQEKP